MSLGFVGQLAQARTGSARVRAHRSGKRDTWRCSISRRDFLLSSTLAAIGVALPRKAEATGLKLFPLTEPLMNRYMFLRAGESTSDVTGQVMTNPVEKLSMHNGLTRRGERQAVRAAEQIETVRADLAPELWVWSATTCKAAQTAELLLFRLNLRRENVVPEYAFLDARGMGVFEGQPESLLRNTVHTADSQDHTVRMQLGEDGTPNESIEDVFVRMRQLLSKTETLYQGCDVVFVAPDSYTLSVLECALMDDDLKNYQRYAYNPGELRTIDPLITDPLPQQYLALHDD
mmetsp:Transcript_11926/g.36350  ORF Transcript_11926/g.36350 Transcript_11926/m.36350 type:complete len:289 (-) Transcript_11926:1231-2097(-)